MSTIGEIKEFPRKLDVEWKMKNFFSPASDDEFFFSPSFSFDGETWCIQMYPNGDGDNNSIGYIDLFLFRHSDGPPVNPEFYFALKSVSGKKFQGSYHMHVFTNEHYKSGVFKFMSRSKLLEKRSELVPDDTLTVVCTMRSTEDASKCRVILNYQIYILSLCFSFFTSHNMYAAFLLSSIYIRRKYRVREIFDFRFSMDLHVWRCPEHDLTIFRKCLSVCLYYFVDAVSQELMSGN